MEHDDKTAKKVSQERALHDLQDIAALRTSEAFNRYFLRRLKAKKEDIRKVFTYDPPTKITPDQREQLRVLLLFCEELEKMMSEDEASAQSFLSMSS